MPLGCAGPKYDCAESAQNHAFPPSVHFLDPKSSPSKQKILIQMSEVSERGPQRPGIHNSVCPQNYEKGFRVFSKLLNSTLKFITQIQIFDLANLVCEILTATFSVLC